MSADNQTMTVTLREGLEGELTLRAPAVGRFRPHPRFARPQGKSLCSPGDELGTLERLGRRQALICPLDAPVGRLTLSGRGLQSVEWGQSLATLTPSVGADAEATSGVSASVAHSEGWAIEAPIDGTVYYSPSPDSPPFVQPGELIQPGQVIALIEVMKFFYEIKHEGQEAVRSLAQGVDHGAPIEAGAPLWRVTSP